MDAAEVKAKREAYKKRMEARSGQRLDKPFGYRESKEESQKEWELREKILNSNFMTDGGRR